MADLKQALREAGFSDKDIERLERMVAKTEAKGLAEYLACGAQLYEGIITETDAGSEFYIKRAGKEIERYEILSDESVGGARH